ARGLPRRQPSKLRDVVLDDKATSRPQLRRNVVKGLDLLLLGGEVGDRVAAQVDQPKRPARPRSREVANSDVDGGGTFPPSKLRDHGRRQFNALHSNASPTEGQRDPASTDAEFERGLCAGQLSEEGDGRIDPRGIEQLRPEDLVPLGGPVIEMGFRHTTSMPSVDSMRQTR